MVPFVSRCRRTIWKMEGTSYVWNVSSEFIFMAAALLFLQVFQLFDVKRNGVIEFGEFVRSLSVFHPHAGNEEKMECETITTTTPTAASVSASFLFMHDLSPQGPRKKSDYFRTREVAFRWFRIGLLSCGLFCIHYCSCV